MNGDKTEHDEIVHLWQFFLCITSLIGYSEYINKLLDVYYVLFTLLVLPFLSSSLNGQASILIIGSPPVIFMVPSHWIRFTSPDAYKKKKNLDHICRIIQILTITTSKTRQAHIIIMSTA